MPKVTLRDVEDGDLPILFEHQLDPEANHMAAFTVADPSEQCAADNAGSRRVLEKCGFAVSEETTGFAPARGQEIAEVLLELR
jgi:hypothetical protein